MLTLCKIPIHLETATDAVKGFQERLVLITLQCINSFKAAPPPDTPLRSWTPSPATSTGPMERDKIYHPLGLQRL